MHDTKNAKSVGLKAKIHHGPKLALLALFVLLVIAFASGYKESPADHLEWQTHW